ncbi:MAG: type II secretion system protein J [Puniceicoccaceae bacterium]
MKNPRQFPLRPAAGFTLLEMMIVTAILGLISMMSLGFFTESIKATFTNEQKNLINRDIRRLTAELSHAAREANFVILYRSFASDDRDSVGDRLLAGNPGDFLVFGFQDEPDLTVSVNAPQQIVRLTGYYRAPSHPGDPSSTGPVRKFDTDIDFDFAANGEPLLAPEDPLEAPSVEEILETLYPDSTLSANPEVVAMSEGLADRRLFYNFGRGTIMVNGKIIHGVEAKRVTDTYNFTISTRR